MSDNPVHKGQDGKWYFWDETWAYECGPYDTEAIAQTELNDYCILFLSDMDDGCLAVLEETKVWTDYNEHIHQNEDGKWYFWDETEMYEYGPYNTEAIARTELGDYCVLFLSGMSEGCLAVLSEARV